MTMTRKKGLALILAISTLAGLSACGENAIPEMNQAELQKVGEYAALTLMKYDAANRSRLVDISLLEEETPVVSVPIQDTEPMKMKPTEDIPIISQTERKNAYSMEEVMGLPEGMTVTFQGWEVCEKYPNEGTDNYFVLTATEGNELLVLRFLLTNDSGLAANVDTMTGSCSFYVTLNDADTERALTTVLLEDMSTYAGTFQPGEGRELVLMVEASEQVLENISSVVLELKNELKTYTIRLL